MRKFASPAKQALSVAKKLNSIIPSVRTVSNYQTQLSQAALWASNKPIQGGLRAMTIDNANSYLEERSELVGKKTLDMDRQALQAMMIHVTKVLKVGEKLNVVKSEIELIEKSRAYSIEQVDMLTMYQKEKNSLSTKIALSAGLRAHELLTLNKVENRPMDDRPAHPEKFKNLEGVKYTTVGKGGLCREIIIPQEISVELEKRRLDKPIQISDRGVYYNNNYDISGGKNWSQSFSLASKKALGWSNGGHGVRHTYAQLRVRELTKFLDYETSLLIVSQEMGHFRPEITKVYLR